MGIAAVEQVANATEALMDLSSDEDDTQREVIDTVIRSLDVMSLMVHDAGRRRQGYPPAALHEAVHTLLEQMTRLRLTLMPRGLTH